MKCLLSPLLHTTNQPCNFRGVLPTLSFSILHTWTEILDSAFVCWPIFDQINHAWYDDVAQSAFGARILFQRWRGHGQNYFGWARFGRRLCRGLSRGLSRGLCRGLCRGLSRRHRTSLREALDLRIADFKGCVLLPLLLLLFEKPSTFCRRRLTPEIEFSNSFRGL